MFFCKGDAERFTHEEGENKGAGTEIMNEFIYFPSLQVFCVCMFNSSILSSPPPSPIFLFLIFGFHRLGLGIV